MTFSKRIGSVLREAEVNGTTVKLYTFTGIGHRPSSNRKRHGYLPHVRGKLTTNAATFGDEQTAIDVARLFVNRGKVA